MTDQPIDTPQEIEDLPDQAPDDTPPAEAPDEGGPQIAADDAGASAMTEAPQDDREGGQDSEEAG